MTTFTELGLDPKILSALDAKGYTTPTPIQLQAIPHLLQGKDILGIAQTGTGKTAAFSLPILDNLTKSGKTVKSGCVRTLILTPTRELASQIAENIELYGKELKLRHAVIFGGVSERPQITKLQRGVDILIATPGRLLDLSNQGYIRFMNLEILVLDEADRMLDMGFINDIKKIITKIPERRQTLFFSATMPSVISGLADKILKDPVKVEITPQSTTVERIDQKINYVEKSNKLALLKRIVKEEEEATSVLVFCRTKHGSDRVEEFLRRGGVAVAAIHGNKSQGARERALGSFRDGAVQVLIATDIAARGIDVPSISHVINYDIPMDPESYVHRIGRTARAGRQGVAISFCDPSEEKLLVAVEKAINYKIPVDETHPFHDVAPSPTSRDSKRDDRNYNSSAGGRSYGFAANKERRSSSSSRDGGRGRDDRRSSGGNRRRDDRPRSSEDKKSGGLLGFMGLGKKRHTSSDQPRNSSRTGSKSGFGWFGGKKSDSSESRSDSYSNRERAPSRGGRRSDSYGTRERSPSRGRRNDSRGTGQRSDSLGNRDDSRGNTERDDSRGNRERSPRAERDDSWGNRERPVSRSSRNPRSSSGSRSGGSNSNRRPSGNRSGGDNRGNK